jgi:hypothetical protein
VLLRGWRRHSEATRSIENAPPSASGVPSPTTTCDHVTGCGMPSTAITSAAATSRAIRSPNAWRSRPSIAPSWSRSISRRSAAAGSWP